MEQVLEEKKMLVRIVMLLRGEIIPDTNQGGYYQILWNAYRMN